MGERLARGNSPASFRDPSGQVFLIDGLLYRQVNVSYKINYDRLMTSGLYKTLTGDGLLMPHEETDVSGPAPEKLYKTIKPEPVPFISYPYEWCFSQLKDAALATLKIQKRSLGFGMSLKDCSAYNIQFVRGKPVLIDTLSFEECVEGRPWVAYRQFCRHFLAPLALMSYRDLRLGQLSRIYIDGIPLDLASGLLQARTYANVTVLMHIHLHARAHAHAMNKTAVKKKGRMSRLSFLGLIDSLESAVKKLNGKDQHTEWGNYYAATNYSPDGLEHKKQVVSDLLGKARGATAWDMGANDGTFSRLAAAKGMQVISFDADPVAVEKNYTRCVRENEPRILPLMLDLANPSPALGWEHRERLSLAERAPADVALVLALVHHLAIGNNLSLGKIAGFLSGICRWLIIEFIPKEDAQVQGLLACREDIFTDYRQETFESEFGRYFSICEAVRVKDSKRTLYLMKKL